MAGTKTYVTFGTFIYQHNQEIQAAIYTVFKMSRIARLIELHEYYSRTVLTEREREIFAYAYKASKSEYHPIIKQADLKQKISEHVKKYEAYAGIELLEKEKEVFSYAYIRAIIEINLIKRKAPEGTDVRCSRCLRTPEEIARDMNLSLEPEDVEFEFDDDYELVCQRCNNTTFKCERCERIVDISEKREYRYSLYCHICYFIVKHSELVT